MSFDIKNKENNSKYCSQCLSKNDVEHVCSSQLLSDSVYTLSEMASEQLNQLDTFSLSQVHTKCEQDLELWHKSAVNHLGQIFNQRLNDLNKIYNEEVHPDLQKYKLKLLEQLKSRILPKINKMLEEPAIDEKKAEQIQGILTQIKSECDMLGNHQWINIHLPDLKNFSVPIRIAKMALAARLTDGEKDPLDDLSDEENKKEENLLKQKKKKANSIDVMEIFASNPEPFKSYSLETNSSTLAFSNKHILIHDNKKLILFDLNRKVHEFLWDDNDYGLLNIYK
jgi:DNA-binding ferritin-like protein (Dps family)